MNFKRISIGTLGLLAAGGLVWGCSDKAGDCKANKNCGAYDGGASGTSNAGASGAHANAGKGGVGSGGEAGAIGESGSSGSGGGVPACDSSANPDSEPCVIGTDYGLFVSPDGNDDGDGDGSKEKPFATVTKALATAGFGAIKRIYVCAADYAEPDTLSIPNHVEVYGGFACDDWSYNPKNKAHLIPASPVGASIASAKQGGVTLQDIRIDALDAASNSVGASSFGLIVNQSTALLRRVEIRAGKATAGKDGTPGTPGADGADAVAAQNGSPACNLTPTAGVAAAQSACGSKGGTGGVGYLSADGDPGTKGIPLEFLDPPGVNNGGPGATQVGSAFPGQNGLVGYPGLAGAHGAGAPAMGTFSAEGFTVASGGSGLDGHTGQGGGGGGGSKGNGVCTGASGGAGGMGGCAGHAGTGGTGGGASIAVLSWKSAVTVDAATLIAGDGGAGGKGGAAGLGGAGKDGGKGGAGSALVGKGGNGGTGGFGGRAGSGAGGSGGPSIALFYSGTVPVLQNNPTLTPGNGGIHGAGGRPDLIDTDAWGFDGKNGLAQGSYPAIP